MREQTQREIAEAKSAAAFKRSMQKDGPGEPTERAKAEATQSAAFRKAVANNGQGEPSARQKSKAASSEAFKKAAAFKPPVIKYRTTRQLIDAIDKSVAASKAACAAADKVLAAAKASRERLSVVTRGTTMVRRSLVTML